MRQTQQAHVEARDRAPQHGDTLDCGHVLEVPEDTRTTGTGGTGYGRTVDGRTHCYACCHQTDMARMDADGRITAYLASDGRTITTWPGLPLLTVTREWQIDASGFCRGTRITRVWARDRHGAWWHGRGPGRCMYIRMMRSRDNRAGRR